MSSFVKMSHTRHEGQSTKAYVHKDWFVFLSEKPQLRLLISDTRTGAIKGGVQMGLLKLFPEWLVVADG